MQKEQTYNFASVYNFLIPVLGKEKKINGHAVNSAKFKVKNHTQTATPSGVSPELLWRDTFAPFSIKYLAILKPPFFKSFVRF